jgi:hypothetical protein
MGHDLPRAIWPRLIEAIAEQAHRADAPDGEHLPPQAQRPSSLSGLQG